MFWKLLVICSALGLCTATSPKAETKYGPIEGTTIRMFNGKNVDKFLGVPFAARPIERLRFAPPQPPLSWNETLETKTFSSGCIQSLSKEMKETAWFAYEGKESEDCLYLNVFKPNECSQNNLPVMVWIHGGAFLSGSASMPLYDGSILAAENNVVVVTMNFRLAMFGLLYLNSSEVPGNAAVQDQIQGIKWVNENIHNFCGDSKRVTLFGESTGGTSVSIHLVNPALSNLFQYGIMESGSLYQDTLTVTEIGALKSSLAVAEKANCLDDDSGEMLDCLRETPVENLVMENFGFPEYVKLIFLPVRNGIEVPRDIFSAAQKVPKSKHRNIISLNIPLEGNVVTLSLFPGKNFTEDFTVNETDFRVLLENYFSINDSKIQDIAMHEYKYFNAPYNRSQLRIEALSTVSDSLFVCPGIDFTKSWVAQKNRVFYLYFAHRPSKPIKVTIPKWAGPSHGDEVPFVFGAPLDPRNNYSEAEKKLSMQMMKYWTNFAKHGNPNSADQTSWPAVEPHGIFTYLELTNKFRTRKFLKERECDFWSSGYTNLLSIQEELGARC